MNDRIGKLDGDMFEMRWRDRGVGYFAPIARRLKLLDGTRLSTIVDDAVQDGRISERDAMPSSGPTRGSAAVMRTPRCI